MSLGYYLIGLAVVGFLFWRTEKWLIKKFKIEQENGWIYRSLNSVHRSVELTLLILFWVVLGCAVIFSYSPALISLSYLLILHISRAAMEWTYIRETRRYVLSLFGAVTTGIFLIVFVAFPLF